MEPVWLLCVVAALTILGGQGSVPWKSLSGSSWRIGRALCGKAILTTAADQPDMEIVGEVAQEWEIFESVRRTLPNSVVIALRGVGNADNADRIT